MTLRRRLLRLYHYPANWFSWMVFALVALLLNLACAPLLLLPNRTKYGHAVRSVIRELFRTGCRGVHALRLIYVNWHGFTPALWMSLLASAAAIGWSLFTAFRPA